MDRERLDGEVALIGGGSAGVGLAAAKTIADLGATVILLSRRESRARRAVEAVQNSTRNSRVEFAIVDMIVPASVTALRSELTSRFARIDVLISAAGSAGEMGTIGKSIPKSFATNYLCHAMLIDAMMPLLSETSRVGIVGAAPGLVQRLADVDCERVDATASGEQILAQALAWKILYAQAVGREDGRGPSVNVFDPGFKKSLGAIAKLFAGDRCAIAGHLASSPELAQRSGLVLDKQGRAIALPNMFTSENAEKVLRATRDMARAL